MDNYVSAHLGWIKSHKDFIPKEQMYLVEGYSYYDIMKELYSNQSKFIGIQKYALMCYVEDKAWLYQQMKIQKMVDKQVEKLEPISNGIWFVTIGFNHQTWNVVKCCKMIEKVLAMEWIISAKANFELFRENGEHPHCHFIIETKEPKSRILEKLFRPLYVKELVLSKNFIDVKVMMDCHHKYINLDKQSEKMKYVEKDIEWRKKHKIPDYEKNWNIKE